MKKEEQKTEAMAAAEVLKRVFPRGSKVFLVLRSRARSGMSRVIGVLKIAGGSQTVTHPNYSVAAVLGLRLNKERDGVHVSGCGMDMGFALVQHLGRVLYDDVNALHHEWL